MAKKVKKHVADEAAGIKIKAKKKLVPGSQNILRARDIGQQQEMLSHAWAPNSEWIGVQLSKQLGLKRAGVTIVRLPAGAESTPPYAKHRGEEWIYILLGEGIAVIGNEEFPVGAGDFLAFPAPQTPHQLRNVGSDDLVCLMGGENAKMDIVDFPTLGKRLVCAGTEVTAYPMEAGDVLNPGKRKKPKKPKA